MARVVLSPEVLAGCSVAQHGTHYAAIFDAWDRGDFSVVLSPRLFEDVVRILDLPYFSARIDPEVRAQYLWALHWRTVTLDDAGRDGRPRNTAENAVLETALTVGAHYVVTTDEDLLQLGWYQGVALLNAEGFCKLPVAVWNR